MKKIFFVTLMIAGFAMADAQDIGVQLYTFRKQIPNDVPGTLEKIRAMGVKNLEGGGTFNMPMPEYKALLDKLGFKMISIGADFKKLQEDLPSIINEAKAFGASYVVCFWIPHTGNDFTLDDAKKAVEVFNTAGKTLKENGLNLCYHPHGYEFRPYNNETLFDYLVKNMNPAYANFEMDVFWIKHPGQEPVALLKKYNGRFPLMHLKDRKPGHREIRMEMQTLKLM